MLQLSPLDGALLVDKPAGMTSHDVVDAVRRHFRIKKVGHCGTLDPNATGLLILVLGPATKYSEKFMTSDKVYEGTIKFGESTSSYDADGDLTGSLPVPPLSIDQIRAETDTFLGDQLQIPPMVSAIKVGGVPLYKLARKGEEIERKPRLVHIYTFRITSYEEPIAGIRIACTKGTYVRSLAHDLGQKIGCGAHLTSLRRLASGKFDVADALPLSSVLAKSETELARHVIPYLKLKTYE